MTMFISRTGKLAIAACAFFLCAVASTSLAQSEIKPGEDSTRIAVVKANDVYVRCGAAESYYAFTKLHEGDLVKVTGEKFEWSRVMPIGPAFNDAFGFVKYSKNESGKFKLANDGKSGITLGKVEIIAPNLDSKLNPKDSWKSLVRLDADQTLRVIEKTETDKDIILKVALPEAAQGWISTAYLDPATPDQVKQFTTSLSAKATTPERDNKPSAEKTTRVASNAATKSESNGAVKPASTTPQPNAGGTTAGKPVEMQTIETITTPAADGSTETTTTTTAAAKDSTTGEGESPITTAKTPEPKKLPTLDDLEAALKNLQKEPIDTAEVTPLRELYLDLARRSPNEPRTIRYCTGRAEQLQVWADLQKKRAELEDLRNRSKLSADETAAVQKALERSAEYAAIGRIAASTIYDGTNLPKLLRIQDPTSGRTVAYLQPDEKYELANLIGNIVGVVGDKTYEGSLRLNIVEPKRIDLLTPESNPTITVNVPTDKATP